MRSKELQLEPKDICGYLPYGLVLKAKNQKDLMDCFGVNLHHYESIIGMFQNEYSTYSYNLCDFEPILRPLSDLYKTITHNGEEIIPIVELAKIAFPEQVNYRLESDYCDITSRVSKSNYRLYYDENGRRFKMLYTGNFTPDFFCNQYQLFDYLHELKIDYRGLIESGLAIDANTLEINPYK
jgi:hypothetical protein